MKELKLIQEFEQTFVEAANLAMNLRKNAKSNQKYQSGVAEIDIVTEADLAVQEFVLDKLAQSELKNCELVAEENTQGKDKFAEKSSLVLTLDPIDGTLNYTTGNNFYSIIVTLHDKKRPLYTFNYFPELNWGIKIVEDVVEMIGKMPKSPKSKLPPKTIIYGIYGSKGDPHKGAPELADRLEREGYTFIQKKDLTELFLLELADGYYTDNGSAVDTLVVLHFALAKGLKIISTMNIEKTVKSPDSHGSDEYPGYYLVLR